ncbi:hypothetical protein FQN54_007753 [Arachnomyces sp. PD_36]|nr:hypothetical protein FQN54_007753 [Arachnomyces sp. PD_36]
MASDNAGRVAPADSAGPSSPPPSLPEGWLAQWEGSSRKWYFVQRTTGKSQWEVPTEPLVPTPSTTPLPGSAGPYPGPQSPNDPAMGGGMGGAEGHGEGTDRGMLTNKLFGTMQGHGGAQGSGYSGSQPGGHSSVTQMAGGLLGNVAHHVFSGKPGSQQQQQPQQQQQQQQPGQSNPQTQGYGVGSSQGGHSHGLLPAIGHSLFGHHNQQNQQGNQFNYSSSGQTSSTYAGTAPQYHAGGQTQTPPMGQNPGVLPTQQHGQVGPHQDAVNPATGAPNQQPQGTNFSQHVGVDAHGSLSSQFASRPNIPPPPPGQPPSHIAPPPGISPGNTPNQYQGVSNVNHQPGMQAAAYPASSQPQWNQTPPVSADHGHNTPGQGQYTGFGVQNPGSAQGGQQGQGAFGQHPTGQPQPYGSAHGSQVPSQAPTTGAQVPNQTHYSQPQQTNQYGQAVSAPPGITPQYASQPAGYPPNQQQTPPNPSQVQHGQYQYQDPNQGQSFAHGNPGYQGQAQAQPPNQYTSGAQQAPIYSQAGHTSQAGIPSNSPYPTSSAPEQASHLGVAGQAYTSQSHQYEAYKPQAPTTYGGNEHLQQHAAQYNASGTNSPSQFGNQYPGANPQQQQHGGSPYPNQQQYGNQQHGSSYGGAPGR